MTALPDLQAGWREVMLQDGPAALAESPLTAIVRGDGIAPERRLGIHRNHLYITLREALAATFPTVEALVGADFFAALATRFTAAQPPTGPCLFEYGAGLPDFLADGGGGAKLLPPDLACLPDVARLDWAFNAVYHAADAAPFDQAALARLPPEAYGRLTYTFVPAFALLRSDWPLAAIWQVTRPDAPADARVDLTSGSCCLAVYRDDWDVVWRRLSAAEGDFLAGLHSGMMLGAAAEAAVARDAAFDLAGSLGWAAQAGLFSGFDLAAADPIAASGQGTGTSTP